MAKRRRTRVTAKGALARRLAGLPPKGKLPALGTQERQRYRSAQRAIQRAAKPPGAVNPRTGKRYQTRAGAKVEPARKAIAEEQRLLRKPSVTLKGVTATVTINNDPRYRRVRSFGDISITRAGFRRFLNRDATAMEILEDYLGAEAGFVDAPGIETFEISDVRVAGAE